MHLNPQVAKYSLHHLLVISGPHETRKTRAACNKNPNEPSPRNRVVSLLPDEHTL